MSIGAVARFKTASLRCPRSWWRPNCQKPAQINVVSNNNVRRCAAIHLGWRTKPYIASTLAAALDSSPVLRRCILSVFVGLGLLVPSGCADPEPERAIFVVRETTATHNPQYVPQTSPTSDSTSSTVDASTQQEDETSPSTTEQVTTTATTAATVDPPRIWTLLAGGDVLLDRTEPEGIDPFTKVQPDLASADVAIVNLEMAITERGEPYDKEYVFRAPGSAALTLVGAGIDVVSLANNHVFDFGREGLEDTISVLDEVGILRPGAGSNNAEAYAPRILTLDNGVRVAFVSATAVVPGGFASGADRPGVADAKWATPRVLAAVRAAAAGNDVVVVSLHWGVEREPCPNEEQRTLAQQIIEAGADLILGHHPHVLQPIETFDRSVIAYSLGNFAWHPRYGITGDTGVLEVVFDGSRIEGYRFYPHVLNYIGGASPIASGDRYDRITDIVEGRCEQYAPEPTPTTEVSTGSEGVTTAPPARTD
ncbi:MAG TPA: CapA family protein [Acidimicrobiia bacterium]|nr:CapA family protein [Acidimicrobiia bacterium]